MRSTDSEGFTTVTHRTHVCVCVCVTSPMVGGRRAATKPHADWLCREPETAAPSPNAPRRRLGPAQEHQPTRIITVNTQKKADSIAKAASLRGRWRRRWCQQALLSKATGAGAYSCVARASSALYYCTAGHDSVSDWRRCCCHHPCYTMYKRHDIPPTPSLRITFFLAGARHRVVEECDAGEGDAPGVSVGRLHTMHAFHWHHTAS